MLPASVEAVRDTPIYARTNGYLRSFTVDIGAHVEAGQILAEIETPEIDEQLHQAQASLAHAEANLSLTQTTFERWKRLLQSKVVAAQGYDERRVQLETVKADVAGAQANVQRLTRRQEFQKIIAPYAATIIIRNTDIGALISGDNSSARMLFRIAQTSTLRVFVKIPQSHYRLINVGVPAELTFREFPGRAFMGKVVRTAGALDPDTRTLRTEVQVPNEQGELIPGLYAEVKFNLLQEHPAVVVPSRAVIIEANGPQIAAVFLVISVLLVALGLAADSVAPSSASVIVETAEARTATTQIVLPASVEAVRTAGALDPATPTLRTEVQVPTGHPLCYESD